jgi:mRNA interferase MazF
MPFNGIPSFGDVVLVPFPFTDQSTSKQRPAVVVSSRAYAQARPDVVLMAITSQVRTPLGFAEALIADWQSAKLLKVSVVKPLLATLAQSLIIRQLGALSDRDQTLLHQTLALIVQQN